MSLRALNNEKKIITVPRSIHCLHLCNNLCNHECDGKVTFFSVKGSLIGHICLTVTLKFSSYCL